MPTIAKGFYLFNYSLDYTGIPFQLTFQLVTFSLNFKSNNVNYTSMKYTPGRSGEKKLDYCNNDDCVRAYNTGGMIEIDGHWYNWLPEYKIIEVLNNQEVEDMLNDWFNANTTPYTPPALENLTGKYQFKSNINSFIDEETNTYVYDFNIDGVGDFDTIIINGSNDTITYQNNNTNTVVYSNGKWIYNKYRNITFDNIEVLEEFKNWIIGQTYERTETLNGLYLFNYIVDTSIEGENNFAYNFNVLNGQEYDGLIIYNGVDSIDYTLNNIKYDVYVGGDWREENKRLINFNNVLVDTHYYNWFTDNALHTSQKLNGTYKFIRYPNDFGQAIDDYTYINFKSNNTNYTHFIRNNYKQTIAYNNDDGIDIVYTNNNTIWNNNNYRIVNINNQYVINEFYNWFISQTEKLTTYINGRYKFNDVMNFNLDNDISYISCDFHINEEYFTDIKLDNTNNTIYYINDNNVIEVYKNKWLDDKYKIIDINNALVSEYSYNWIISQAILYGLVLYNNTSEDNRIDKSTFLTEYATLFGTMREGSSVTNLELLIEYPTLPTCNYAYFSLFNRYYFITNITSVNKNLWLLSLKCDVLYTYRNIIYSQKALINRCSDALCYNLNMVDNNIPTELEPLHTIIDMSMESWFSLDSLYSSSSDFNFVLKGNTLSTREEE